MKEIMFLFYTSRAQNPLRYFYDLILSLLSDCKRKDSAIRGVNMCDMTLMSGDTSCCALVFGIELPGTVVKLERDNK